MLRRHGKSVQLILLHVIAKLHFMIDVRRLRVLRELDRRGTVAAAAEALHLTPSAVSQQLAVLARETGVRLLVPDGRRVRMTPAARVLLGGADEVFAALERTDAALAAHARGEAGEVRVAAFPTAMTGFVVPTVAALRRTHPALVLRVLDVPAPACFDGLSSGELDVAVSMEAPGAPTADDARVARRPLLADPLDAVVPAGHPAAGQASVLLTELAADPWVVGLPGTTCAQVTLGACSVAGFTPEVRHRTDDYLAVLGLVAAGCCVALVPRLAGFARHPGVAIRPVRGVVPRRHLFAAVRRGSEQAPHLALVLDTLADHAALAASPAAAA